MGLYMSNLTYLCFSCTSSTLQSQCQGGGTTRLRDHFLHRHLFYIRRECVAKPFDFRRTPNYWEQLFNISICYRKHRGPNQCVWQGGICSWFKGRNKSDCPHPRWVWQLHRECQQRRWIDNGFSNYSTRKYVQVFFTF